MFSLQVRFLVVSLNLMIFLLGNLESSGGAVPSGEVCICVRTDPAHITISIKPIYLGSSSIEGALSVDPELLLPLGLFPWIAQLN